MSLLRLLLASFLVTTNSMADVEMADFCVNPYHAICVGTDRASELNAFNIRFEEIRSDLRKDIASQSKLARAHEIDEAIEQRFGGRQKLDLAFERLKSLFIEAIEESGAQQKEAMKDTVRDYRLASSEDFLNTYEFAFAGCKEDQNINGTAGRGRVFLCPATLILALAEKTSEIQTRALDPVASIIFHELGHLIDGSALSSDPKYSTEYRLFHQAALKTFSPAQLHTHNGLSEIIADQWSANALDRLMENLHSQQEALSALTPSIRASCGYEKLSHDQRPIWSPEARYSILIQNQKLRHALGCSDHAHPATELFP
jgi:hypothetical protein